MRLITYGIPVAVAAGALGLAACSGSSSPGGTSAAQYYQEGYHYARTNISQSEHQTLSRTGYAKWCAHATATTRRLNNAPGGAHSNAAHQWVRGCNTYAASVRLPAKAVPAATPPPSPPPPPAQAPSSPSTAPQPSQPAPVPSQPPAPAQQPVQAPVSVTPPPFCDPVTGICAQAPAPPPGGFPGGGQNPCNGPMASEIGDCIPGGGINGGR